MTRVGSQRHKKKIFSTVHKACMVSEGIAPFILNFSSGLGGWSASRHGHFTPSEKDFQRYERGWDPEPILTFWKKI
jgi:hypothetical protein